MRRVFLFSLLVFAVLALPSRVKLLTYGFKLEKLQLSLPPSAEWEVGPILTKEELSSIFSQPFFFLGKGAQSYVFESRDGRYVCKLFRFASERRSFFWDRLKGNASREEKATQLFTSCLLAWNVAREETALLYLHLNPTANELPTISAKAPSGRTFQLELDRYRFCLQKRVVPIKQALKEALADGTLFAKLEAVTTLLEQRTAKGISNRDPSLWRNFGFLEDKAVELDFGRYVERPDFVNEAKRKKEMECYLAPLRKWTLKHVD